MPNSLLQRSSAAPSTINRDERTFEAVLSTGADVPRMDQAGPFIERLAITAEAVDVAALVGAPLLDGHQRTRARDVLGRVLEARIENGAIVGRIQFSSRPDAQEIFEDVAAGNIRGLSLGYRVSQWTTSRDDQGRRVRTAVRWEPAEVSLVAIAADPAATIRSSDMPEHAAPEATPEANPAPANNEHQRAQDNAAIRDIANVAGLDRSWADQQIDANATVDGARAAAFDAMRTRSGPPVRPATVTSPDTVGPQRRAMVDALAHRMQPGGDAPAEGAQALASRSLLAVAEQSLQAGGTRTSMMSSDEILQRSMHTTSDFAVALQEAGRRVLLAGYETAPAPMQALARRASAQDFRERKALRMGGLGTLDRVHEHGEIRHGSRDEEAESYRVQSFAKIFSLSRESLVNDDLSSLADWASAAGRAARETENQQFVDLLTANSGAGPVMRDNANLFHVDHGNVAGTAGALDVAALADARLAMRRQVGADGVPISAEPRTLVVAPEDEQTAEQVLATITPSTPSDVNPFSGRLQLAVDSRLQGGAWYVFASPQQAPVFEFATLNGRNGPMLDTQDGFEILGVKYRVVHDFGIGVLDWRGAYRNAGA